MPAFVFPGQGSQHPGMGRAWTGHPSWELVGDVADAAGRNLPHLLLDAGAEELTETRNAQLVTFTMGLVVLDAVERLGIEPTSVAGHSVGEYTALVAAGALGFEDGVRVVTERGEAMQAAADARPGTMMVVAGCDPENARVACQLSDGAAWVANYNTPDEVVLAGDPEAVARAAAHAKTLGAAGATPAAVGGAFHTPFMAPARSRLRKALAEATFHEAEVPVVANVDSLPHDSADDWDALLRAQLVSPVRWHQSVLRLAGAAGDPARGESLFVEVGPGGSLSGMIRRTVPGVTTVALSRPDDLDRLVDVIAGDTALHAYASGHQGERLYVSERMVISPCPGLFTPAGEHRAEGDGVEVGTLLGTVSGTEVRSPFGGILMGMLAQPGERIQTGQPIAWLRAS